MVVINNVKSILIIGIAGGLAQVTADLILKNYPHINIIGVDNRPTTFHYGKKNVHFEKIRYTRSQFERIFREYSIDVVFHLGRLGHADISGKITMANRMDMNLIGTNKILELSLQHKVKKVLVLSTFHVYGALADNPVFIKEDAPLRASINHPELRDVTEMDQLCTNWMWKNQKNIEMIVLRPCNIIGPRIRNTMSQYLAAKYAPVPVDFNPMFQFIHEIDMAEILVKCIESVPIGVYNVASNDVISLKEARKHIGLTGVPVPIILLEQLAKMIKPLWNFPEYLIDYVKFPSIIDASLIQQHLQNYKFQYTLKAALEHLAKKQNLDVS